MCLGTRPRSSASCRSFSATSALRRLISSSGVFITRLLPARPPCGSGHWNCRAPRGECSPSPAHRERGLPSLAPPRACAGMPGRALPESFRCLNSRGPVGVTGEVQGVVRIGLASDLPLPGVLPCAISGLLHGDDAEEPRLLGFGLGIGLVRLVLLIAPSCVVHFALVRGELVVDVLNQLGGIVALVGPLAEGPPCVIVVPDFGVHGGLCEPRSL